MADVTAIEQDLMTLLKTKQKKGETKQKFYKRLALAAQEVEEEEWESLQGATQEWANAAIKAIEADEDIPDPEDSDEPEDSEDEADEEESEEDGDTEDEADEDTEDEADEDTEGDEDEESDESEGDGEEDSEESGEEDSDEDEDEDPPPKKKGAGSKKSAVAKKADKKPPAKAAKGKEKAPPKKTGRKPAEGGGAQGLIKRLVIDDPTRTTEDILTLVHKEGYDTATKLAVSTIRSGMLQSLRLLKSLGKLKGVNIA